MNSNLMNRMEMKRHVPCRRILMLFMLLPLVLTCDESLPPYEELSNQIEVSLSVFGGNPRLLYGDKEDITFVFTIIHHFDEVLEKEYFFKGSIDCWMASSPSSVRHLEFTLSREWEIIHIEPEKEFTVSVKWDQRFDSGFYLWQYVHGLPATFTMRATGEIQTFREFGISKTNEVEFNVTYTPR